MGGQPQCGHCAGAERKRACALPIVLRADVLGEPLVLPDNSEGAAYGAAVLGFISAGEMAGIADTAALVHAKKVYTTDEENHKTYAQLADISGRLYRNLQREFAEIAAYQAGR